MKYLFNFVITTKSWLNAGSNLLEVDYNILFIVDYFPELVVMYENVVFVRSMVSANETVIEIKNFSKLSKLRVRWFDDLSKLFQ